MINHILSQLIMIIYSINFSIFYQFGKKILNYALWFFSLQECGNATVPTTAYQCTLLLNLP